MHRNALKDLLQQYTPQDPGEQSDAQLMLQFIDKHEDCFERSCMPGHFTASAWLINREGTHALLMHHRKLNSWFQLGGHCDGDPDVLATAIKEAQEESGIMGILPVSTKIFDIDVHLIPAFGGNPIHYHYDIRFLLQVTSEESTIQNDESNALQWFSKDEDLPTQEESVLRMFEKWKELGK